MCLNSNGELLLFDNVAVDVKNVTLRAKETTDGGFVDFQNVQTRVRLSMSAETLP